jgi:uncharacterized BrkB/YihY/UPF0761 family membrane protein
VLTLFPALLVVATILGQLGASSVTTTPSGSRRRS